MKEEEKRNLNRFYRLFNRRRVFPILFFFHVRSSRTGLQDEGGDDYRRLPGGVREGALRGRRRPERGGLCLGVQQQRRELRSRAGQV